MKLKFFLTVLTMSTVLTKTAQASEIVADQNSGCFIGDEGVLSLGCGAQIINNVINLAFSFLGIVTVTFFLLGAFKYVTSAGDDKAIQAGRNRMIWALAGAIFVGATYTIINIATGVLSLPDIIGGFTLYQK